MFSWNYANLFSNRAECAIMTNASADQVVIL